MFYLVTSTVRLIGSLLVLDLETRWWVQIGASGLYFAGCLSHGKDFKRAAGGFIHGFRYVQ